jgi:hypothetical protein
MAAEVDADVARLAALGRPPRWYHMLADDQWWVFGGAF